MSKKVNCIFSIFLLSISYSVYASCQCPSELLSNLRPITGGFAWGIELGGSYYLVKSNTVEHYYFPQLNSALTYNTPINLGFLLNFVVKYRPSSTVNCPLGIAKSDVVWGIWQSFAEFSNSKWHVRVGRQQYINGLGYIFDIRMDGIMITRTWTKCYSRLFLGTVASDIGQNGFFCAREVLLEERICSRQLCNARYGQNSLLAISVDAQKFQLTVARQFARVRAFNEYLVSGVVNLKILKNLSLISEFTPRFELDNSCFYYTVISYLNYRTNFLRIKIGGLISNKPVLLGLRGLGERMRFGPMDRNVGFFQTSITLVPKVDFQINYYHRINNQYPDQNSELDIGFIIRTFPRTQIFLFGVAVDLLQARALLQSNIEIRYVL
ncbi:MAG: hypothetical protein NZ601_05130 [candidate division WOR-3 bacterium]|nr:hypothetical protein [candidate division WOR-3 bacterium]MDW7987249.1 hypothetical protein [candidate division WOR-3 bacterium]